MYQCYQHSRKLAYERCVCVYIVTPLLCVCTCCMRHCCVRVTPCFCASSFASGSNPVSLTASTTVCHVRGRSPVPLWQFTHLLTRSSIQSLVLPKLSLFMASISMGSTPRKLPNSFHFASTVCPNAFIISVQRRHANVKTQRYHSSNSPLKCSYQMGECVCVLILAGQKHFEEQLQHTHQVAVVERQQCKWGEGEGVRCSAMAPPCSTERT